MAADSDRRPKVTAKELEAFLKKNVNRQLFGRKKSNRPILKNKNLSEIGDKLKGQNLDGADLEGCLLNGLDLRSTSFVGANLINTEFKGADLIKTNFSGVDFTGADLRGSKLNNADIEKVQGLRADRLGGCDLTNTNVHRIIEEFKGLDHVEQLSKHARTIFLSVVAVCVFCWLTITNTTDVALLTNSASSALPIIQAKVPMAGFFWAAPAVLLTLFLYLHFYLQGLWEGLAGLPAIFPDGRRLDERAYPWLLTSLVINYVELLKDRFVAFRTAKVFFSIVVAYALAPITIAMFLVRYWSAHDWRVTGVTIVILALSVSAAFTFYWRMRATFQGEQSSNLSWRDFWTSFEFKNRSSVAVGVAAVAWLISYSAINGTKKIIDGGQFRADSYLAKTFEFLQYNVFAGMAERNVSKKPADWIGEELKIDKIFKNRPALKQQLEFEIAKQISNVEGVDFSSKNLNYVNARSAFLVKSDFRFSWMIGADLRRADLRNAEMRSVRLKKAHLQGANLKNANLKAANLADANFKGSQLGGVQFLSEDTGIRANVTGVDFNGVEGLEEKQLREMCSDGGTLLPIGLYLSPTKITECRDDELEDHNRQFSIADFFGLGD